jgi:signal transduction histidine kinase/CheY-like chemotaxis protein
MHGEEAAMVEQAADAQVVSAEQHAALRRDHAVLQQQFAAANEVLSAVGRFAGDPDQVLHTILDSACRLCRSDAALLYLLEDGVYQLTRAVGVSDQALAYIVDHPLSLDRRTLSGRVGLERTTGQIPDVLADPDFGRLDLQQVAGFRTTMAAPMLFDDDVVGVLNIWRSEVRPFDEREMAIGSAFAGQAAMALTQVKLVQLLQEQRAELAVASRHKSEFLASMSHELRTPLNAVLGFSEVLLEQMFGSINERQEEYLRDIHGSGQHLLELLNEILDLSKVEAGRMEVEYATFELVSVLDDTVALMRERAAAKSIDLRVEVGPGVETVYSDRLRLKQVLVNLVSNAVKFTGGGGTVTIRARKDGTELEITVSDTGVGVPAEDTERIFESFQQGGRGPSSEEGTGLGLTLSRRLVELLGGRMWLESEVGVGSTFGFSVRADGDDALEHGSEPSTLGAVVVIEDDRPSLDLLAAYLSGAALQVTTARDGPAGIAAVRRVRPAVVLLDLKLPGIDGWAVLQTLKADPETKDIPVVIASIVDDRARGLALGAAAYLVKPISRESLFAVLSDIGVVAPTRTPEAADR